MRCDNQKAFLVTSKTGKKRRHVFKKQCLISKLWWGGQTRSRTHCMWSVINLRWSWVYALFQIWEGIMTTQSPASNSVCWWWSVIQNSMGTIALCYQTRNMCLLGRFLRRFRHSYWDYWLNSHICVNETSLDCWGFSPQKFRELGSATTSRLFSVKST